jgi:TIR domain
MKYDLFISHANEDKSAFVDRLAQALKLDGYRVWYDGFELKPGRSLRRSIDEGLAESAVGVVILSRNFFAKEWALRELDALVGQETYTGKLIIPIWWGVTRDEVARYSPLLADRIAIIGDKGPNLVVAELEAQIVSTDKFTDRQMDEAVARFFDPDIDNQRFLRQRCLANFSKVISYYNAYERQIDETAGHLDDPGEDELPTDFDGLMAAWLKDALRVFEIPDHVYLRPPGPISSEDADEIEARMKGWCSGSIGQYRSAVLMYDLDEWLDADYLFVLFGIPNFRVSPEQRERLNQAVIDIGARATKEAPIAWATLYQRVLNTV